MQSEFLKSLKLVPCAVLVLAAFVHAQSRPSLQAGSGGRFVTFDIPGAGTHANQGTLPRGMNRNGETSGYYIDNNGTRHGFVIGLDGNIATFDVLDAGTGPGQGTVANDISPEPNAWIVGQFADKNSVLGGFLRHPDGSVTEVPSLLFQNINENLYTAGLWRDGNNVAHGFIRSPEQGGGEKVTSFDAPGAGTGSGQGTFVCPGCLNDLGAISGRYVDSNGVPHGFVRSPDPEGNIQSYDPRGAMSTFTTCINYQGQVVGYYMDANNVAHGYLRQSGGSIESIDAPGAGTASNQGTFATNLNNLGVVFGYYIDSANISHGFLRSGKGTYRILDAPGAGTVRGGTQAGDNTDTGLVSGNYLDNNLVNHGYYWISILP